MRWATHGAGVIALGLLGACGPSEPVGPKPKELRTLTIAEPMPESPEHGVFGPSSITHLALIEKIAELETAPEVSAVMVQLGAMNGAWGRAADLRDALGKLRRTGKPVHCHFEDTDNVGYALLADSCDRLSISPGGSLDLVGVSVELLYARELLQTLGLRADLVQAGRYKGAADTFTRDDMPPEVAQTMNAILDELQSGLVSAVARGRKLTAQRVQSLMDDGPFTADQAKAAGLVDAVSFDDAAREHARRAGKAERVVMEPLQSERAQLGLRDLLRAVSGEAEEPEPEGPRLLVAYLDGTIMRGAPGSTRSAQAEAFVAAMRGFGDDPDIKAVVLRIDSPGGSALASDLMWHAVRRVQKRKPVIVSIGDMAASGGYYVASAGSEILAQDQSLVGSIGVVGGKIVAGELADRAGVNVQHLTRAKHADWATPWKPWSPEQRNTFEVALRDTYERFLARVAEGRGKSRAAIESMAQGRLLTARRAREGGLIDRAGGLSAAIARARERAKLGREAPIEVWPRKPTFFEAIGQLTSGQAEGRVEAALLERALGSHAGAGVVQLLLSGESLRAAAVLPYGLRLR